MNAVLPKSLETPIIANLSVGDEVYTVSQAMWVDYRRKCWLHPNYPFTEKPSGTSHMKIVRLMDGFRVYASATDETWELNEHPCYVERPTEWLPVVELL